MKKRDQVAAFIPMIAMLSLVSCGGSGGTSPIVVPTRSTSAPSSATCPSSGTTPSSIAEGSSDTSLITRRAPAVLSAESDVSDTLVIASTPNLSPQRINGAVAHLGAKSITDLHWDVLGLHVHIVSVDPTNGDGVVAQLKAIPGVFTVEPTRRRYAMVAAPNDPAYIGTSISPYYQTASSNGQWDMHVMNLDAAWARFSVSPVVGAKIAIIDTGADVAQTELSGSKIVLTKCYVTYPAGTAQTTGTYVTDTDGHGTNVAGIADAQTNNNMEFAGVAWSAPLMVYRIFPSDIPGGCATSSTPQCATTDIDEVSAINDAVTNGAKVINLSIGATPPCTDSIEQTAIERAISLGVVVVAAAGNEAAANLDCPASYPGVIAVGASALNDSASPIKEYVASYSNYVTTTGGGYFLVAPGGDPVSNSDADNLHWILNLYSSTAADLKKACASDCRIFIAGTSQAVPHVVGIVSLVRAINPRLTPAQVAQDLCSTADNLGDPKQGCGRVNAGAAVALAASQ